MAKSDKILIRMRNNPRDWRVDDVLTVAKRFDFEVRNPRGSHFILYHNSVEDILSVPARKPVKPVYIRKFVEMIDRIEAHDD